MNTENTTGKPVFLIANGLPVTTRFTIIGVLAVVGIVIQMLDFLLPGFILVFCASLVGVLRSKSPKRRLKGKGKWNSVSTEQLKEAYILARRAADLKKSTGAFSCSTKIGKAMGSLASIAIVGAILLASYIAETGNNPLESIWFILAIDAAILLLPLWFTGQVRPWEPPNMTMKLEQLMGIFYEAEKDGDVEVSPSLMVRDTGRTGDGPVPVDARMILVPKEAPDGFYGIQVQVSTNKVQSNVYPYTYCVILAEPGFGLSQKASALISDPSGYGISDIVNGIVTEIKEEPDAEILVVRQDTDIRTDGYTTSVEDAKRVYNAARNLARKILDS